MDVEFGLSGLEIEVAEGLEAADLEFREFHEDAAITREAFEVEMALLIEVGTHLLDLEIGHIADTLAQGAFVRAWAAELETLDKAPLRQELAGGADDLGEAYVARIHGDDMGTACDPDYGFVLVGLELTLCVNLEQLRMDRSLEEANREFINCYVNLRRFHISKAPLQKFCHFRWAYYTRKGGDIQ
jgi:hypothetical protein